MTPAARYRLRRRYRPLRPATTIATAPLGVASPAGGTRRGPEVKAEELEKPAQTCGECGSMTRLAAALPAVAFEEAKTTRSRRRRRRHR
jgi:hypothetical protein